MDGLGKNLCTLQIGDFVLLCEGRAGRVSKGYCYRLIRKDFWADCIPEKSEPEMLVRLLGLGLGFLSCM